MGVWFPGRRAALTKEDIRAVIKHVRSLCAEPKWPHGNLNLPRPLFTEKAFPEDEIVLTTGVNLDGAAGVDTELVIEKRLGARSNMELIIPGTFSKQATGSWFAGVGDVSLELKRTLAHSLRRGSIVALAGEVRLSTCNASRGLGNGITFLESFLSYGQILPRNSFVQTLAGVETPIRRHQILACCTACATKRTPGCCGAASTRARRTRISRHRAAPRRTRILPVAAT